MRHTLAVVLLLLLVAATVPAQNPQLISGNGGGMYSIVPLPYGPRANPGGTSALWVNPAGIGVDGGSGFLLMNSFVNGDSTTTGFKSDWGLGVNLGRLAYGMESASTFIEAQRHTIGFSLELEEGMNLGVAYHWSDGLNRQNSYDLGLLVRPARWLSFGYQVTELGQPRIEGTRVAPSHHFGLALRPFVDWMTLAADAVLWESPSVDNLVWGMNRVEYGDKPDLTITANIRPVPYVEVRGGYAVDREMAFAGLSLFTGAMQVSGYNSAATKSGGRYDNISSNWLRFSSEWRPEITDHILPKKLVRIKLKGGIVEEPTPSSTFELQTPLSRPSQPSLYEVLKRLRRLREDEAVAGIILEIEDLSMGFSDRVELREELKKFRDEGKTIIVYATSLYPGNYYLASVADRIILHPAGDVNLYGISSSNFYLKGLLDKLGIEAQFLQHGKYKSAVEIFTREGMSEPAREARDAIIETLWQTLLADISEGRRVSRQQVESWVDGATYPADDALAEGLVDTLAFEDEVQQYAGNFIESGNKKVRIVSAEHYFMKTPARYHWEDMTSPKIAIVYATGSIVTGKSDRDFIFGKSMGSETVANAIRKARNDKRVKAIVFRIDSGGGSALASDIILREIDRCVNEELGERRVPVIVSMSDVAGSGGYYIACKGDTIVAPETCITGSIGVLTGKFVTRGFTDKLGITFDNVRRGENSNLLSLNEPWDEEQIEIMRHSMDVIYKRFTGFVAEGRGMDTSRVNELGQGRIWSGRDALENGLVDVNGGLFTAISLAKKAAGIEEDRTVGVNIYPSWGDYSFKSEVRAMLLGTLPESVQTALEAEAFTRALKSGEPLMICPIDPEALVTE